ncbi:sterol desaturase family protein [Myxococcus sp. K15C18031901]|uniref:sterol desaturase family protein n=1 Tax=Myxococcus dinghuensis TaxID=2906761 RepID=UPI0020A80066|nr:sterol desaturase family protein [Myxococcus dinghuensis]MCP3101974.1 sterol desaturase family protein [Myxococcus dinghuensis]
MVHTFEKLFPTILVVSSLVKSGAVGLGLLVTRFRQAERLRVYRKALAPGQLRSEAWAALKVVLFDAVALTAFQVAVRERFAPFGVGATLATFVWMFVGFEVWFYVTHRLLHTRALYRFHAQHHVAQVTEPLTSLSFSLVERTVLLAGNFGLVLLAMEVMPVTMAGAMLYVLTNYALNVVGHSNTEWLPSGLVSSRLGGVLFTPTFHALHHARHQGHYGLFTTLLDRWLGTAFEDYARVHARARTGAGLERVGERVQAPEAPPATLAPTG